MTVVCGTEVVIWLDNHFSAMSTGFFLKGKIVL
ncbi:hypothetical protein [Caudoviricetes sp.]|nr:hypothetical protein [Caudoviricetes sp.]